MTFDLLRGLWCIWENSTDNVRIQGNKYFFCFLRHQKSLFDFTYSIYATIVLLQICQQPYSNVDLRKTCSEIALYHHHLHHHHHEIKTVNKNILSCSFSFFFLISKSVQEPWNIFIFIVHRFFAFTESLIIRTSVIRLQQIIDANQYVSTILITGKI